jgi:RNA polymerase sigma factor (sigma-70 family)
VQKLLQGVGTLDQRTYKLLEEQDWDAISREIVNFAQWEAWRYKWQDGNRWELAAGKTVEDVVQDAIEKTIAGVRRWDPDKGELRPWLKAQVKSIMNHLYHSGPRRYEEAIPEDDEDEEAVDRMEYRAIKAGGYGAAGTGSKSPEETLLRRETEKDYKEQMEQRANMLFQAVSGDSELEEMLQAIMDGCEPQARHLAAELGVSVENIYNRNKRLQRHVAKLMKGESS